MPCRKLAGYLPWYRVCYLDVLGVLPPEWTGLHIHCIGLQFLEKLFSAVGESSRGVGGADEGEGTLVGGISENCLSVAEGIEAVGNSPLFMTLNVSSTNESVDYLGHIIYINHQGRNSSTLYY